MMNNNCINSFAISIYPSWPSSAIFFSKWNQGPGIVFALSSCFRMSSMFITYAFISAPGMGHCFLNWIIVFLPFKGPVTVSITLDRACVGVWLIPLTESTGTPSRWFMGMANKFLKNRQKEVLYHYGGQTNWSYLVTSRKIGFTDFLNFIVEEFEHWCGWRIQVLILK